MVKGVIRLILAVQISFFLFSCGTNKKIVKEVKPATDSIPIIVEEIPTPTSKKENKTIANFLREYLDLKYPDQSFNEYLYTSVKQQKIYLIQNDSIIKKYPVSTAKKGVGNKSGSEKTPSGLHAIKKKYGATIPLGGILKSRVYTNTIATIYTDKRESLTDDVTSRIMWLHGLEKGINKGKGIDSYKRYIYIHGTSEEGLIGAPASHGCIRMKNADVIELFDLVKEGTPVIILNY